MIPRPNGASAQSIWAHLVEGAGPQNGDYPRDSGDFGRCLAFADANPEIYRNLHRMAEVNAYWSAVWDHWDELCRIDNDGRDKLLKAILSPIQRADPSHVQIGPSAFLRVGPITFNGKVHTKEEQTMSGPGHNSGDSYSVTADELRQFIERVEQLAAEKKDIAEQEKELFAEAKGRGYDTKVMRKVIALRKRKPDEIAEEEAVLEMYKSALGMS